MKKISVVSILIMLAVALSSCTVDSRLEGDWELSLFYYERTERFSKPLYKKEINFSKIWLREISKYPDKDEKEFNFKYRYEISYKNDEGGAFYRFSTTSERVLFAYIFDENMLILIEEDSKDKYVYVRK